MAGDCRALRIEKTRHAASVRGGLTSRPVGHQPAVILGCRTHPLIDMHDRKIIANLWTDRLTYT